MKKFEELLAKRNAEIDAEEKVRNAKIRDLRSKKTDATLGLVASIIATLIGYYLGIVKWDGGLFTGFFMQLLFIFGGIATIVFFILLLIYLTKSVE